MEAARLQETGFFDPAGENPIAAEANRLVVSERTVEAHLRSVFVVAVIPLGGLERQTDR